MTNLINKTTDATDAKDKPQASEVRQIFDRIAPVYDQLNDWLSLGQHRVWKKMAVNWAQPQPGDKFLDLCCGSGDVAMLLAKRVAPAGKVIGVDFACEQLAIAAERTCELPPPIGNCLIWQEGDALDLPFADRYFDGATIAYGLRNVTNISKCLAELQRVLKPGAIAAILDFNRTENPIAAKFQQFYLDHIVVPIAKNQGMEAEYAYIMPSLERFPLDKEQVQLGLAAGFTQAKHYAIANTLMGVLVLTK
ncbi:demethylmenaquinone methyltransferase [Thalassoporum mexicanum PCC 7367]|uniref:bifunctional demethylmenaquinone methyltransferase/2-methoxy-6-polyprenyl-1,4-benzoquinol methylase UbiE n=1 Tax=Thalassoporum mexicanum TaxID=3457544 RepID=UPI00029FC81B|nr:bifunctional demethylmenaquinone methyltransferase/2-methoxy-6-polyprenyl-1,4-benzoquinol methylase UbiE [Pseudanabaena sp. PCC 7367]AFY69946.1 demethylmenaquinone methyltransferase [Pseudanabaena sp. PCC 7367]